MAIYWGPELNCIYNDAERDVLGNLHPGALGMPARELLRDSWEITGPQLRGMMERGETTWAEDQPLTVDRRGTPEAAYFTYSYSPILDDHGKVGGVLLVTQDTTDRVLAERRLEALRGLTAHSMDAPTERQACEQALALAGSADVPFALVYLIESGRRRAQCVAAGTGWGNVQPACPTVELANTRDEASMLFRTLADRPMGGMLVDSRLVRRPGPKRFSAIAAGVRGPDRSRRHRSGERVRGRGRLRRAPVRGVVRDVPEDGRVGDRTKCWRCAGARVRARTSRCDRVA